MVRQFWQRVLDYVPGEDGGLTDPLRRDPVVLGKHIDIAGHRKRGCREHDTSGARLDRKHDESREKHSRRVQDQLGKRQPDRH